MRGLPMGARIYLVSVSGAACALLFFATTHVRHDKIVDVAVLGALYLISESLSSRGSRDMLTISLGSVVIIAAVPLVGVWGAILVAWTSAFAHEPQATPLIKRMFNGSMLVVSAGAAGGIYHALGGTIGLSTNSFPSILLPVLAADVLHCAVNGGLVAIIVGLHNRVSPVVVFQGTMARSVVSYLAYGLFGVSLAVLWDPVGLGPVSPLLLLLPLFVARWAYAQYAEEQRAYDRTVRTLMAAVETKDLYTRGHSERVSAASVMIAREIGMREDRVVSLRYAGMLHDVGKLGVPTRVLQKSGGLNDDEFAAIQRHPMQGLQIVREIDFLEEANAGIMHHHERLDGNGYPMGLRGDQIPEFARVISVADAFDSMTTTRSYRGARTLEDAIAELRRCSGTQFDGRLVEALVRALDQHGWDPEEIALFTAPDPDQIDQTPAVVDHDDPTRATVDEERR
jgi:hypothetical protein